MPGAGSGDRVVVERATLPVDPLPEETVFVGGVAERSLESIALDAEDAFGFGVASQSLDGLRKVIGEQPVVILLLVCFRCCYAPCHPVRAPDLAKARCWPRDLNYGQQSPPASPQCATTQRDTLQPNYVQVKRLA